MSVHKSPILGLGIGLIGLGLVWLGLGLVLGLGLGLGLELWLFLGLMSPVKVKGEYVCRRRFYAGSFSLNFDDSVAHLSFYYV